MCLCIYFVILVGYLALITTLFPRMRISHPYYDCADEAATIPYTAIVGLFNIIIGPAYIIIIWRYKDAYGIRTSMCIIFALGIIIWGLVIAWKATTSLHVRRISSSLPYLVQMTIGHTFFVVIPLYKSVHFARLRKRGLRNAEPATGNSIPMETDISTPASMELSMQAFLELMRTSIGHKKIAEYADACFCPELILFLDVFAAFKGCIYNDLKQKHAMLNADIHTDEAHAQHNAINLGLSVNSGTDTTCSTHNTRISMASTTRHNRISRMFNTGTFASLVKPNEISESISRISARSHNTVSRPNTSENTTDENAHAYLRCIDTGIVETIALAFPSMNITNKTLVPDNLRCHLDAIIKTFILVGSALEINTTADTILKAKAYLDGDKFDFGTLDSIKIQVLELLYSNVYIRFYQQNQ
ncbi:hypothetical protein BX070DRAFT_226821 [Coemansia spiralis]|nr:hypothetical protein BX070DRAFT_226821 [Coemansia spiralis]